ncbi:putative DNA double-strand break repair Rad50 ATPase [Gossypium australe]|uniref:Putative DNA double-strand break repair Rad50 ATPase n=1 Tax=Gossypium australe TaxID=47621 RepID=A0A5B6X2Y1_9ROSI|nr:putative DNA double-strand break repair Rad50 ATPase [Gossypium australe]
MISQLTQLLAGGTEKGKSTINNSGDDNEDPIYPLGFTSVNVQAQPDTYPRRVPVTIRPQQYQANTSALVNYLTGLGSIPGDNPTNPVVPDLDDMADMDRAKVELPKQLEDQCKWLEEKFRAIENADYLCGDDAKELSLVPDLWYNQLSRAKINLWKDLTQVFMKQFNHVTDMTPDRITLQNIEKKQSESFR